LPASSLASAPTDGGSIAATISCSGFDEGSPRPCTTEREKQGITIYTGCTVTKVDKNGNEFKTHLSTFEHASDKVMFAIGRHSKMSRVSCLEKPESPSIRTMVASRRRLVEDRQAAKIYAIGDVTHRHNLTQVAIREGHAFADTVSASVRDPPWSIH